MSFGLMLLSGLRFSAGLMSTPPIAPAATLSFWSGMPSTTYRGSLLALIEVPPRIRICAPPPGSPLFVTIWSPATRPWSIWLAFVITPTFACSASTVATEPVIDCRFWAP
jgi:hypothetical protein